MAKGKARAINNVTFRQLQQAIDDDRDEGALGATPSGVFEKAEDSRADKSGLSFATAVAGWAVLEAVRQQAPRSGAMKTWIVTSGNPRPEHAAMNGETVGLRCRILQRRRMAGRPDADARGVVQLPVRS